MFAFLFYLHLHFNRRFMFINTFSYVSVFVCICILLLTLTFLWRQNQNGGSNAIISDVKIKLGSKTSLHVTSKSKWKAQIRYHGWVMTVIKSGLLVSIFQTALGYLVMPTKSNCIYVYIYEWALTIVIRVKHWKYWLGLTVSFYLGSGLSLQ